MMNLPEYIRTTYENIINLGGDGSVVFTTSASSAMINNYNIISAYTNISKRKNPPVPISVTSKSTGTGETYTCFKFNANDMNLNTLNRAIQLNNFGNVQVVEYGSTINLEIYL